MAKVRNAAGYVTLAGGFLVMTVTAGIRRSTGLLFLEIVEICDVERSMASLPISLYFVTAMTCSGIGAWLVRRTSTRLVMVLGGLISSLALLCASFVQKIELMVLFVGFFQGLGHGFLYIPTVVLVSKHFRRRRTLAVGLCGCGGAVGAFTVPPIVAVSSERYAGPGMLMILSAVTLHAVLAAVIMRPAPPDCDQEPSSPRDPGPEDDAKRPASVALLSGEEAEKAATGDARGGGQSTITSSVSMLHIEVVDAEPGRAADKTRSLLCLALCRLVFYEVNVAVAFATFTLPLSFFVVPPLAEDAGVGRLRQSFILQLAGFTDVVGRLTVGLLSDRFVRHRLHLFLALMLAGAANWMALTIRPGFGTILAFNLLNNGIGPASLTMVVPLVTDLLGLRLLDVSMAFHDLSEAVLLLVVPPLLSLVRQSTGSWVWAVYSGCGCCLLSIAVFSRQMCRHVCRCR